MSDTSATGGPLAPEVPTPPLEGQSLNRFFQTWVVALTGLDGTVVRPRWQPEPSNIPAAGEAWCAIGITRTIADTYPYVEGGNLQRHEDITLLLSFYDLGTDGQAQYYAALFRDGASIPQNLEVLQVAGMGMVSVGELVQAPVLIKQRWLYRVDVTMVIRRAVTRTYQILDVAAFDGELITSDGNDYPINVSQ